MANIGILAFNTTMVSPLMESIDYIDYVSLLAIINEQEYSYGDITVKEYFDLVDQTGAVPKTSQPSTQVISNKLQVMKDKYDFIFVVAVNRDFSGTYQNCKLVCDELGIADRSYVIDAESITLAETALIDTIIRGNNLNKTSEEIIDELEQVKTTSQTCLFPGSFKYLNHSGRISGLKALMGVALNMKIFLQVKNGKADVMGKGRGINSVLKFLEELSKERGYTKVYYGQYLVDDKTNQQVISYLESIGLEVQPCVSDDFVAPTHFGPNTFGVCFYKGGF